MRFIRKYQRSWQEMYATEDRAEAEERAYPFLSSFFAYFSCYIIFDRRETRDRNGDSRMVGRRIDEGGHSPLGRCTTRFQNEQTCLLQQHCSSPLRLSRISILLTLTSSLCFFSSYFFFFMLVIKNWLIYTITAAGKSLWAPTYGDFSPISDEDVLSALSIFIIIRGEAGNMLKKQRLKEFDYERFNAARESGVQMGKGRRSAVGQYSRFTRKKHFHSSTKSILTLPLSSSSSFLSMLPVLVSLLVCSFRFDWWRY